MRILFITTIEPTAESNGGAIYTRGLLKLLAKIPGYEVVVISCQLTAYSKAQKLKKLFRLAVAGLHSSKPMKAFYFLNADARARIKAISTQTFDFVIYDHLETLWAADILGAKPSLLISQNLEYELQRERLLTHRFGLLKLLLKADTEKLGRFETRAFKELGGVIFISAADQKDAAARMGGISAVIPPIFETAGLVSSSAVTSDQRTAGELRPAFVGDLRWWPNRANLQWLIDEVLPRCTAEGLPVCLDVYGKGSEQFQGERLTGHGFVPDINVAWSSCDFLAAPTLVGGGLNVKIAEAVCNGVPIVTTSKAAQAFEPEVAACFQIADTPQAWVNVFKQLSEPAARQSMRHLTQSKAARFSEAVNVRKLSELLVQIVATHQAKARAAAVA